MSRDQNGQYKNVKKSERFCAEIRFYRKLKIKVADGLY
ncbi:hypothetical protein OsJ_35974 [Oryza sativa Japonica Group]|uniref:Uncharacterized protein n=1 Tax=Oryza sativa subsp. japonica TaxID=39947 RepID=B9GCZ5_ORYSJ|nr:hypothetical protein OsJ_35974 [Oryza sativa Japonica Group]